MEIWGDQLEFEFPLVFYDDYLGLAGFIIQNLQIDSVSEFLAARHDVVVDGEVISVMFGLEWFHQDGIHVDMKEQHAVVVTTERVKQ